MPTLHAVDDLGMDPTGTQDVMGIIDDAYGSDVTIEFPPGEYLVDQRHVGRGADNFVLRGLGESRRDVRFVPNRTLGHEFIRWDGSNDTNHAIENLSFDQTDDLERSLGIVMRMADGLRISNCEWLGRTPEEGDEGSGDRHHSLLTFDVTSESGVGIVEDTAIGVDAPAEIPPYPRGRPAIRSGPSHRGEAIVRRCEIRQQGSTALRYTDNPGVLTARDLLFVDNANANLRFGAGDHPSKVSTAARCEVVATADATELSDLIRLDGEDPVGQQGAELWDCIVIAHSGADVGRGLIVAPDWGDHGSAYFENCIVQNNSAGRTVYFESPEAWTGTADEVGIEFNQCDFTGTGGDIVAQRAGCVLRDCCVDMPNATISNFDTINLVESGCRLPSDGDTPQGTPLSITNDGSARTDYEIVVDGEIIGTQGFGTGDEVFNDGTTATGFVAGGTDGIEYEGCVQSFEWAGPDPIVTRDGVEVALDEVVECPPEPDPDPCADVTCPEGEECVDGDCLPICNEPYVYDPETGDCLPPECSEGMTWDPGVEECVPICADPYVYDPATDECVPPECGEGMVWDPDMEQCVSTDPDPEPDPDPCEGVTCPEGEECVDGDCVPIDEPDPEPSGDPTGAAVTLLALGVAAAAIREYLQSRNE